MVKLRRIFPSISVLGQLLSRDPAGQLIRQTARQQWRLLALNLCSNLIEASTEGATLAIVFLAIEVLTAPKVGYNWAANPLFAHWPAALNLVNMVPATTVFLSLLALAVLLQALQSVSKFLSQVSIGYFGIRCKSLVTKQIHSQMLNFSFQYASSYKVGDLTNHFGAGPEAIRAYIQITSDLAVGALLIATYLLVLVSISPWLLLSVFLIVLLIFVLQRFLLPRISAGSYAVNDAEVAISTIIIEDIQGLRLLHSYGQLDAADQRLRSRMAELEHLLRGQIRRLSLLAPFASFLPILAFAVVAGISVLLLGDRSSGVLPSLVTFILALQRLNVRLSGFASNLNGLATNSANINRLNQILSRKDKQFRRLGGLTFRELHREICFENVFLRYGPELPTALNNVSFSIAKNQMLALVGPSGAGKSSIADLLTGLFAPSSGQILIDGVSMDNLDMESWQQRIGVVSQDTFLLNTTIAENIAFGSIGADSDQIRSASLAAQAAGFIEELPQGYETLVGERGYRLSGGQRQRLSLARAILRAPELLILDEATSALDSHNERMVQQAIERFENCTTVLVIAHRLSTIVRADKILVMESGRVVEQGCHGQLLSYGGLYTSLWQQQSRSSAHGLSPSSGT